MESRSNEVPERSRGPFTHSVSTQRFGETVCLENTIRDADGCTLIRQWYSSYAAGEYVEEIDLAPGDWHLFAAAPEMLEAMKAIDMALAMGYPPAEVLQEGSAIRNAMEAAIAKAEGRTP